MSRKYRNTAQWLELIEAFEQSVQNQVEFCAEHNLNPAYFSKRCGELLQAQSDLLLFKCRGGRPATQR